MGDEINYGLRNYKIIHFILDKINFIRNYANLITDKIYAF